MKFQKTIIFCLVSVLLLISFVSADTAKIYFVDNIAGVNSIGRMNSTGHVEQVISGYNPNGLFVDDHGFIYACFQSNVRRFFPNGTLDLDLAMNCGYSIIADSDGYMYTSDRVFSAGIRRISPSGSLMWHWSAANSVIALGNDNNLYGVIDGTLFKADKSLNLAWSISSSNFTSVSRIVLDSSNNIYVAQGRYSGDVKAIHKYNSNGAHIWSVGTVSDYVPLSLSVDPSGYVYYNDHFAYVRKLNPVDGSLLWTYRMASYDGFGLSVTSTGRLFGLALVGAGAGSYKRISEINTTAGSLINVLREGSSIQYSPFFVKNINIGCMDTAAVNYDPAATVDDGICYYNLGCTDPDATNYDPDADIDDGSCVYEGCMDPEASNYNPEATIDDGSCYYEGCMDPGAVNYDEDATVDDGSCYYFPGCTNYLAYNFDKFADFDDATCLFGFRGLGNGTSDNPFQVNSIEELSDVRYNMSIGTHYLLMRDLDFLDNSSYLDPDLMPFFVDGAGWLPIGGSVTAQNFRGVFDGNQKIIKNLYINRPSSANVGLFAYVRSGSIRDLGLEDIYVSGGSITGGLIGELYLPVSVERVYTTGVVRGGFNTGGVAGRVISSGGVYGPVFVDSYSMAEIQRSAGSYHGGFLGTSFIGSTSVVMFINCYAGGKNTVSDGGGFLGYSLPDYPFTENNTFWDTESTLKSVSASGIGKTTAQMRNISTFTGWSIAEVDDYVDEVWKIQTGFSRPILGWQEYEGVIMGCTDPLALNFDPNANMDDGSCYYNPGCTDIGAANYDASADFDDGSCYYNPGCMDPVASNFNKTYDFDDGSCVFNFLSFNYSVTNFNPSTGFDVNLLLNTSLDSSITSGTVFVSKTGVNRNASFGAGTSYVIPFSELPGGAYSVLVNANFVKLFSYDFWNIATSYSYGSIVNSGGQYYMCVENHVSSLSNEPGFGGSWQDYWRLYVPNKALSYSYGFVINASDYNAGCTDPAAVNYDSSAEFEDGSCLYAGCTDPEANNYDPDADIDDDSCTYTQPPSGGGGGGGGGEESREVEIEDEIIVVDESRQRSTSLGVVLLGVLFVAGLGYFAYQNFFASSSKKVFTKASKRFRSR